MNLHKGKLGEVRRVETDRKIIRQTVVSLAGDIGVAIVPESPRHAAGEMERDRQLNQSIISKNLRPPDKV